MNKPDGIPDELYTVLTPGDGAEQKPLIHEIHAEAATHKTATALVDRFSDVYGRGIVCRVVPFALDQVRTAQAVADLLDEQNNKLDQLIDDLDQCMIKKEKRLAILEWLRNLK